MEEEKARAENKKADAQKEQAEIAQKKLAMEKRRLAIKRRAQERNITEAQAENEIEGEALLISAVQSIANALSTKS